MLYFSYEETAYNLIKTLSMLTTLCPSVDAAELGGFFVLRLLSYCVIWCVFLAYTAALQNFSKIAFFAIIIYIPYVLKTWFCNVLKGANNYLFFVLLKHM